MLFLTNNSYVKAPQSYVYKYIAYLVNVQLFFLTPLYQLHKIYEYNVGCKTVGFGLEKEAKVALVYFDYPTIPIFTC